MTPREIIGYALLFLLIFGLYLWFVTRPPQYDTERRINKAELLKVAWERHGIKRLPECIEVTEKGMFYTDKIEGRVKF